jgi:hypothetical protein
MTGFLNAARGEDNTQVLLWLATPADSTALSELLNVYGNFEGTGGLFWAVAGVQVTRVTTVDAGHADVTLSEDVVWCLGLSPSDPAATCSAVNGVAGPPHTYLVELVDGRWKADIDVNSSSSLDHNPQASPTVAAPTPTAIPTPT